VSNPDSAVGAKAPTGSSETGSSETGSSGTGSSGTGSSGVVAEPDGEDRILTVPNLVTLLRLAGIGVFVWLLFGEDRQTYAAVLLAVLGATDWVDGFVARRFHQVSNIGKVLDPVADRMLVATAVISVLVQGAAPIWFGVATIAREVLVSLAVLLLASLGAERIDVLFVGKAGTFGLMFAYPTFLLSYGTAGWQGPIRVIAWVTGAIGLGLAWLAAGAYVPVAVKALRSGRAGRSEKAAGARGAG
jgi:cardiolipin synthase